MEVLQDSVPFPYDARVAFLKSIAEAAGRIPEAPEVRRAKAMPKDLCPSMFKFRFANSSLADGEEEEDSQSNGCGKASPVCVLEESYQATCEDYNTRRKHSRTCPEEPSSSPLLFPYALHPNMCAPWSYASSCSRHHVRPSPTLIQRLSEPYIVKSQ